jgi:hypothetical protein
MRSPGTHAPEETVSTRHVISEGADSHPRPSAIEALERSKMRHPASDRVQRLIWTWFFVILALLLTLGVVFGLQHT